MRQKGFIYITYFTMLSIVGALIVYPANDYIFYSLQGVFGCLAGFFLGRYQGALSQLLYVLLGLLGLPIFILGGGISYVFNCNFGYIVGLIFSSYIVGIMKERLRTLSPIKLFACCISGLSVNYIIGMIYQVIVLVSITGLDFGGALFTLCPLPIIFLIQAVTLLLFCFLYPKGLTMHKIEGKKKAETPAVEA